MGAVKTIIIGSIIILGVEAIYFKPFCPKSQVLGQIETPTPTPSLESTPSPTPDPTPTPTAKATSVPTPTIKPQPVFTSQQINEFIDRFAAQYGADPNLLRHIALCESGFNPSAYNAGYAGLYQFGKITWRNVRGKMGEDQDSDLRYNAEEAVQTAAYNLHINNAGIWPNCVNN